MNVKVLLLLFAVGVLPLVFDNSYAQITSGGFGNSPFERDFGDVKFLDAYFGTMDNKLEVDSGDRNVPFTVVLANVGTQDITGIRGQLSLPLGFSAADGPGLGNLRRCRFKLPCRRKFPSDIFCRLV